eukprot:690057-Pyramimonas_sp.AAC.1
MATSKTAKKNYVRLGLPVTRGEHQRVSKQARARIQMRYKDLDCFCCDARRPSTARRHVNA